MQKEEENLKRICIHSFLFERCKFCNHAISHDEIFENQNGCAHKMAQCPVDNERIYEVHCVSVN